jgi:glycosyltransferase involved in cell wall biosynthesis
VVAGSGAKKSEIRKYEKTGLVTFKGRVSDEEVRELYAGARALLFPGIEDFGIIPVEAQACGCPVIAFRRGGALDTVKENVTGLFFDEQTPESLIAAMEKFERNEVTFSGREVFKNHVLQFSKSAFTGRIKKIIDERKRV